MAAIAGMDLDNADFSVTPTQEPIIVDTDRVMVMVEVRARRGERTLHNYAAHLMRIENGLIVELHMVEAKPAESDTFWSAKP